MPGFFTKVIMAIFVAAILAGCHAGNRGTLQKASQQPKKRGEIYLAVSGNAWTGWQGKDRHRGKFLPPDSRRRPAMPRKVSMVKVVDGRGGVAKRRPAPVSAADRVVASLKNELKQAGYQVKVVRKLPRHAERGLDLSVVSADLRQESGLFALKGDCELSVTLDRYRHGFKEGSDRYTSTASAASNAPAERLFPGLVEQAAQDVADEAVSRLTREI